MAEKKQRKKSGKPCFDTNLKIMSEGNKYFIDQNIEYIQQVSPYIRKLNTIISSILGIRIYTKFAPLQLIYNYTKKHRYGYGHGDMTRRDTGTRQISKNQDTDTT